MNNLDKQYTALLQDILDNGVKKGDRTGTGTISVFGRTIRHKMSEGFPLLTTKKMYFNGIVSELIWFLQGRTDLRYLLEQNNLIWVGDAYKAYEKYCKSRDISEYDDRETFIKGIKENDAYSRKFGDLGPIYGKQWRSWDNYDQYRMKDTDGKRYYGKTRPIDQMQNLINDLKKNPDSRRLMVTAWNPAEINQMTLPPCHYGFQCYTRELSLTERIAIWDERHLKDVTDEQCMDSIDLDGDGIPKRALSLSWNQRSVDTPLGLPFNIASYGLLLEILAKICNMVPDELIGNLGDTHIYSNQVEGCIEQIGRELELVERRDLRYGENIDDFLNDFPETLHYTEIENSINLNRINQFHQIFDEKNIPKRTREPFQLPTLKHMKTDEFWSSFDVTLFGHLDPKDFVLENYQSHSTIKFPLSN